MFLIANIMNEARVGILAFCRIILRGFIKMHNYISRFKDRRTDATFNVYATVTIQTSLSATLTSHSIMSAPRRNPLAYFYHAGSNQAHHNPRIVSWVADQQRNRTQQSSAPNFAPSRPVQETWRGLPDDADARLAYHDYRYRDGRREARRGIQREEEREEKRWRDERRW
jgi:hypothetical protein